MKSRIRTILSLTILCSLLLLPGIQVVEAAPATWTSGDEYPAFNHYFSEEYWSNGSVVLIDDDESRITLAVSYLNTSGVEAFLVAANTMENKTSNENGTWPYQMFGLHYYTEEMEEVFITANFAFLFAYYDEFNGTHTNSTGNNLPDVANEPFYYVIPFGTSSPDGTYNTSVEPHPVVKNGEGDYTFGITYHNLSAKVVKFNESILNLLWSLATPSYFIRFSELTVEYHITMDDETGEVVAESFYTIGQVTEISIFGLPLDPTILNDTKWTLGVAHFVNIFTSEYEITKKTDETYQVSTGSTEFMDDNLTIRVGEDSERAFDLDFRGTYSLHNETSDTVIEADKPAYNLLLQARSVDIFLLFLQIPFSLEVLSVFAYSHSEQLQKDYTGPQQLLEQGAADFSVNHLWYAVEFPEWRGYRVVHDPTYTAHVSLGLMVGGPPGGNGGFELSFEDLVLLGGLLAVIVIIVVVVVRRRR